MTTDEITNLQDVIDSRDVIERIAELEADREALAQAVSDAEEVVDLENKCGTAAEIDTACALLNEAKRQLREWEGWEDPESVNDVEPSDEARELQSLKALQADVEQITGDWEYGVALIKDSYFENHAMEQARECGLLMPSRDVDALCQWPLTCIDWAEAAEQLKADYHSVDFGGLTYWVR